MIQKRVPRVRRSARIAAQAGKRKKSASIQPVGILDIHDFHPSSGHIHLGNRPVKKAIVLLYMPTCPHCQEPKRVFQEMDLRPYGAQKLAVNCAREDELAQRAPELFGFSEAEYTVPKLYIVKNGRMVKQLPNIQAFRPQIEFRA